MIPVRSLIAQWKKYIFHVHYEHVLNIRLDNICSYSRLSLQMLHCKYNVLMLSLVFVEETWHSLVLVTLNESATMSPCVFCCMSISTHRPYLLALLYLQQVCAPFLGCQGIFDSTKKWNLG